MALSRGDVIAESARFIGIGDAHRYYTIGGVSYGESASIGVGHLQHLFSGIVSGNAGLG